MQKQLGRNHISLLLAAFVSQNTVLLISGRSFSIRHVSVPSLSFYGEPTGPSISRTPPLSTISEISVGACRPQDNLIIKISPIAHHISYDSILSRMSSPTGTLEDDHVQDQISISPAISPRQGTTPSVVPVRRPLFFNDDSLSVHPSDVENENEDEEEPYGQVRFHQQFRLGHEEDDREVGLASDDDDGTDPMGRCMPMPIWEHHPPPRTFPEVHFVFLCPASHIIC